MNKQDFESAGFERIIVDDIFIVGYLMILPYGYAEFRYRRDDGLIVIKNGCGSNYFSGHIHEVDTLGTVVKCF